MTDKSRKTTTQSLVPVERIEGSIVVIRGHRVILDETLAEIYGVPTKRLNEQVTRNKDRFPSDFMFRLTKEEWHALRSRIATSKEGRGGRRYPPRAFTEHGTVMAANVLNSKTAVQASIQVVRAFVRLRQIIASHEELARKLATMERKYDKRFKVVFDALRQLMAPPEKEKQPIGFQPDKPKKKKR